MKNFEIHTEKLFDGLDEIRSFGNTRNADRSALLKEELSSLRYKVMQLENRIQELESRQLDGPPSSRRMPLYSSAVANGPSAHLVTRPVHYRRIVPFKGNNENPQTQLQDSYRNRKNISRHVA